MVLSDLKPRKVFEFFELLCSVPHGSGNTGKIADLIEKFAAERGLKYVRDELNNIVIYKKAAQGMEDHPPVIIQGHMDMVCAAEPDAPIDMSRDGLALKTDGKYVWADRTSLGGDDCIAVATAMALLDSDSTPHPPLECVFTVDEETGMYGAAGLDCSLLDGRTMINLDSEDEGVFTVGCAGGLRISFDCRPDLGPGFGGVRRRVCVSGLKGGHSGAEINRGRANANKLLARALYSVLHEKNGAETCDFRLCGIHGGQFDNVITAEAYADVIVAEQDAEKFETGIAKIGKTICEEYATTDPEIVFSVCPSDSGCPPLENNDVIDFLFVLPQGVQEMSFDMPGLVETSCNLGIVNLDENGLHISVSVRSSVESRKRELADKIAETGRRFGFNAAERGDYPGWKFAPESRVRDVFAEEYSALTGKQPRIEAIHAGLECGFFVSKIPGLDCISLGPNLYDIHTSRERLEVASVERMFELVKRVLARK